jgi:tetratricopeptide (TPR) repeat protein
MVQHRNERPWQQRGATYLFFGLIIIAIVMLGLRLILLFDNANEDVEFNEAIETALVQVEEGQDPELPAAVVLQQMAAMNERAEDSVTSAEIILSFLEGAAVLVGLAIGAAALYGFNQINDINERSELKLTEFESRIKEVEADVRRFDDIIKPRLKALELVEDVNTKLNDSLQSLEQAIDDVAWLLQADQEFRLGNYYQARQFSEQVLRHNPDNPLALYILGWLKVQHIRGLLDEGIEHFDHLKGVLGKREMDWVTARAVYGVALRRKATDLQNQERMPEANKYLNLAKAELEAALALNNTLMDFNRESFWGPVGGIYRDLDKVDDAIDAYKKALGVTPGSSYPQGNLAGLYLRKVSTLQGKEREDMLKLAEKAFHDTRRFAQAELANLPNDYFHMMDVAMSCIMAGDFESGNEMLDRALETETPSMLMVVSLSGWRDLMQYCPDEWADRRKMLDQAIHRMQAAIEEQAEEEDFESDLQDDDDE